MDRVFLRWVKLLVFVAATVAIVLFLISIGDLVQLLVISALLAYTLDPIVSALETRGFYRSLATLLIFVAISAIIFVFMMTVSPIIRSELFTIRDSFTSANAALMIEKFETLCRENLPFLELEKLNLGSQIAQRIIDYLNVLLQNLFNVFSILTSLIVIPFALFFFLKDAREIKRQIFALIPNRYFEFSLNLLHKVDRQMGNYLRGQIVDAMIIGVLSGIAMWIVGVKFAIVIGVIAGITNMIPYVGPITGALTAIIISLVNSGDTTLLLPITIAFAAVQLIDNMIVQPTILSRSVNLPPILILIVVIIGGKFFGILGMLLSVPAAGVIKISLKEGLKIFRRYQF